MRGERELVLYLTSDVSYFEHSTFGYALDALEDGAIIGRTCWKCHGVGILDEPHTVTCFIDHYTREKRHLAKPLESPTGKDCDACEGTGNIKSRRSPPGDELVTARPSVKRQEKAKEAPPDQVLMRYAAVSRRLSRMRRELADALALAWGDSGEAVAESLGRSWAATPVTRSGRALLAHLRETSHGKHDVEPWRQLAALIEQRRLDAVKPLEQRTKLLAQMAVEATELLAAAEVEYERQLDATQ